MTTPTSPGIILPKTTDCLKPPQLFVFSCCGVLGWFVVDLGPMGAGASAVSKDSDEKKPPVRDLVSEFISPITWYFFLLRL